MPVLQAKCCVHPLPVQLTEGGSNGSGSLRQQLDAAAAEAAGRGIPVRGLLVTNPNNPLGTIYSDESLLEMLRWCLDNKVHYIRWVWACFAWPRLLAACNSLLR
jgi:aspartate/methionine/tyrosine aminotransferase